MSEQETNRNGSVVKRAFVHDGDRYKYDFGDRLPDGGCGWIQYDTRQDAWYFGVWVNPETRQIMTYAEGDETLVTAPTEEAFQAELADMAEFYGDPPPAMIVYDLEGTRTEVYDTEGLFGRGLPGEEETCLPG